MPFWAQPCPSGRASCFRATFLSKSSFNRARFRKARPEETPGEKGTAQYRPPEMPTQVKAARKPTGPVSRAEAPRRHPPAPPATSAPRWAQPSSCHRNDRRWSSRRWSSRRRRWPHWNGWHCYGPHCPGWPRVRVAVVWPIRKGPFRHGRNSQSRVSARVGRHGRTVRDVQARARIDPVKPVDHAFAGRCANHATTKEMRRHRHPEYLAPGPTRIPAHSTGQPPHDLVAHWQPRRVGLAVPRPAHEPRPPEEASLARYGQRIIVSLHYQSNNGALRPGAQVEGSQ